MNRYFFTGVLDHWENREGNIILTYTIIVCESNDFVKQYMDDAFGIIVLSLILGGIRRGLSYLIKKKATI